MQSEQDTDLFIAIKSIEGKTKTFSKELLVDCFKFSKKVVTQKYKLMEKRNQPYPKNWEFQHTIGKLQEWSVYRLLHEYGCSEADLKIYENPTYNSDLTLGKYKLHCKSVASNSKFGKSFTFQAGFEYNDYDKTFDHGSERDIVICGTVDIKNLIVEIIDVQLWDDVKPYLKYVKGRDKSYLEGIKVFYDPLEAAKERKQKL